MPASRASSMKRRCWRNSRIRRWSKYSASGRATAPLTWQCVSTKGETLRQVLAKGTEDFTEERIAQVMGPIFDALEMLHREQVFHRDIAPRQHHAG